MSRFFRTSKSTSSSDSDSDSTSESVDNLEKISAVNDDLDDDHEPSHAPKELSTTNVEPLDRSIADGTNYHRDMLIHALLEERCMNEVLASDRPPMDPQQVKALASDRYRQLCADLAAYNIVSTGLDSNKHAGTRQLYRDGLNALSQQRQQSAANASVPVPLRRLLTNEDATVGSVGGSSRQPGLFDAVGLQRTAASALPFPPRRLLSQQPQHSIINLSQSFADSLGHQNLSPGLLRSRYYDDFEEMGMLGRGGYGLVYHVRHRLDNQMYAVKKIPLGSARLQRIQQRGETEVQELLRELRTLAKLDHPNVVRYFNGWIEWVDGSHERNPFLQNVDESFADTSTGAESSDGYANRETSPETSGIVFETSDSRDEHGEHRLQRVETRSTIATVSDETLESIDRDFYPSVSAQSAASGVHFSEPTLAIHVQMALSAMTLADFVTLPLAANVQPNITPLTHCFHIEPTVSVLLAILDGLEYLHGEGIVHRDIKPANIFLSPASSARAPATSIYLGSCTDCEAENQHNPIRLEVRIGDFGLVTVADPDASAAQASEAVGTEIYRPVTPSRIRHSSLDIYALGIIAFELVWKFNTRMERMHTLQQLKQGVFPNDFVNEPMKECIASMLAKDGTTVTIPQIRQQLAAVIAGHKYAA